MRRLVAPLALVPALVLAPALAAAEEPDAAVAEHPIWAADGVLESRHREALLDPGNGFDGEQTLALLDFLDEARSPVADGDHGEALLALLELPRRKRRPLLHRVGDLRAEARSARDSGDTDKLRQLQTRISVITSELAGRRADLGRRAIRRRALRDLRRLHELAVDSLWERHELNWRLRGPMRPGTADVHERLGRYYRRHEHDAFASPARTRYLEVLAEVEGGGLDALNAYDWGGVSVGLAQFAASGPYLGRLLQRVGDERPKAYRRHVERRGLTVSSGGWLQLDGRPLIPAIRGMEDQNELNRVLLAIVDLIEEPKLRRSLFRQQIALADELIDRAMALTDAGGRRLADALASPRGQAHLADAFINTGLDDTLDAFEEARRRSSAGEPLVDAFVVARREFYESTGQAYQTRRLEAIEAEFGRPAALP